MGSLFKKTRIFLLTITIAVSVSCVSQVSNVDRVQDEQVEIINDESVEVTSLTDVEPNEISLTENDEVLSQINSMTTKEKVGQLVIASLPSTELDPFSESLIKDYHIGGFILFSRNIETESQTQTLIADIKASNVSEYKMFIAVDEEGGVVSRIPETMQKNPTAQSIGDTNDLNFAYEQGAIVGKNLKTLGFNLNFAPVCDVNSNINNPVIGNRAFSSDPDVVGIMAKSFYNGMKNEGILGCVKHFPGHGDTDTDSHLELPVIYNSVETIKSRELMPFKVLIEAGVGMVMTSHIVVKEIDEKLPATLSSAVKKNLLFDYLNFKGVVITDDINMKAISDHYPLSESVVIAINSGCDIVLISGSQEDITLVLDALNDAANSGEISKERLDDAVYKILIQKKELG